MRIERTLGYFSNKKINHYKETALRILWHSLICRLFFVHLNVIVKSFKSRKRY